MTKHDVAQKLRECRKNAKLTQKQLGELIGRPAGTIASWEYGKGEPDANTFIQIFEVCGQSIDGTFEVNYSNNKMMPDYVMEANDGTKYIVEVKGANNENEEMVALMKIANREEVRRLLDATKNASKDQLDMVIKLLESFKDNK